MQAIGLGLDFQHRNSYSKPLCELYDSFIHRLSHISIVGLKTIQETKLFKEMTKLPILHHFTGVAPAGVDGINLAVVRQQIDISKQLDAIWCLEDIGIWNIGPYSIPYFSPPVLCEDVLRVAINGVRELQREAVVPFLAELPSCSFIAGDLSLEDFFSTLVRESDCGMVLDVSHVFSYAIYSDKDPISVLSRLPMERVIEIHVAGGNVHPQHRWRYRDTHNEPILDEVILILSHAITNCPNLRAITYEIGSGISLDLVDSDLDRLQQVAEDSGFVPRLEKLK
jgi:uncharacterized protein (UPF0276 family)